MGPSPTATASGTVNKRPEGYTVVFSNGAVDFGTVMSQSGTVAQFYFDGSNAAAPKVTAYAWNGRPPVGIGFRPEDSWQDGSDNFPGVNPPDKLITSLLGTTFSAVSVVDTVGTLAGFGGTVPLRTFRFKADITNVIDHTPLYPASGEPWTGAEFGSTVGIWMHNYVCVRKDGIGDACQGMASTPGPTYGADGYLTSWDSSGPGGTYGTDGVLRYAGFFDRADQPTTFVPEPSTALLVAFGTTLLAARRRPGRS